MRCPACQVDLNGSAAHCPLCGGPAQDVPPLIEGVPYQEYPRYEHGSLSFWERLKAWFHC